jgi:hypothetical protein
MFFQISPKHLEIATLIFLLPFDTWYGGLLIVFFSLLSHIVMASF